MILYATVKNKNAKCCCISLTNWKGIDLSADATFPVKHQGIFSRQKVVHTVVVRPGASEYSNSTSSVYHYFYVFFQLTISLSNRSDTINHGETLRTT